MCSSDLERGKLSNSIQQIPEDAAGHARNQASFSRDSHSIEMKRTGPSVELKALTRSIKEVEDRFLRPYLVPTVLGTPTKQEMLDVAAYVVLVHGALEGFAESLAHWLLQRSVSNWTAKRKASPCTVSLLLYQDRKSTRLNSSHT